VIICNNILFVIKEHESHCDAYDDEAEPISVDKPRSDTPFLEV
jgi:hypothetical protein